MTDRDGLTISEIEERTGVQASTLRIWEVRHGFPEPRRLVSGHRRYSERDCEVVRRVLEHRAAGLSLGAAIERVRSSQAQPEPSVYGALRRLRPDLPDHVLNKRALVAISHAIEDECFTRASKHLVVGSFQTERFYRQAEPRWQDMARGASLAAVFAAFEEPQRTRLDGPLEMSSSPWDPSRREWLLLCDTEGCHVCLAAWERPGQRDTHDAERLFEAVWTLDPSAVREAIRLLAGRVSALDRPLSERMLERAAALPAGPAEELRTASAMMSRMVAYLSASPQVPGVQPSGVTTVPNGGQLSASPSASNGKPGAAVKAAPA